MAAASLCTVVDPLTSAVDYLRVSVDATGDGWLECSRLVGDPAWLAEVVGATKQARGTTRDDVAMSLFVQGYVFRIATVAIGAWLLDEACVDAGPVGWSIAIGRGRPNAVALSADVSVTVGADVHAFHRSLIERHLAPLVDTAHASCRVGSALLWGNVAASCAAAFAAFSGCSAVERVVVASGVEQFFATARPEIRDAGDVVRIGDRFAWRRRSCCLWYQTDSGFMCEDCSLRPDSDHDARIERLRVEVGT